MAFLQKDKLFSKQGLKNYSLIVIGSFILAASFVLFVTPYKIVPGGVYGISIVLHYIFGTPVGMMALVFDIPLTIIGVKVLGPRFGAKTVLGFVLTAVFVDTLTYFYGTDPLVENDALLSSVFGGLFMGVGLGLIFKSRATSGGSDIVAMMLSKFTRLPVGQLMIAVDSTIVLLGLIVFKDWKIPLYSLIVIFVTGKVIDTILEGMNYEKVLLIVSDKIQEIRQKIIYDLNRGGTLLKGEGLYSEKERPVLLTVVNRRETVMLQHYINQIDPDAFVTVINANEILGNGFKSLREKVEE
jgi:uncharacterized membrane-anchored protein YitT (DUF2179 family)